MSENMQKPKMTQEEEDEIESLTKSKKPCHAG